MKLKNDEVALIKKLCQPNAFWATPEEAAALKSLRLRGFVMRHRDGSFEVTDRGADAYIDSVYA